MSLFLFFHFYPAYYFIQNAASYFFPPGWKSIYTLHTHKICSFTYAGLSKIQIKTGWILNVNRPTHVQICKTRCLMAARKFSYGNFAIGPMIFGTHKTCIYTALEKLPSGLYLARLASFIRRDKSSEKFIRCNAEISTVFFVILLRLVEKEIKTDEIKMLEWKRARWDWIVARCTRYAHEKLMLVLERLMPVTRKADAHARKAHARNANAKNANC